MILKHNFFSSFLPHLVAPWCAETTVAVANLALNLVVAPRRARSAVAIAYLTFLNRLSSLVPIQHLADV